MALIGGVSKTGSSTQEDLVHKTNAVTNRPTKPKPSRISKIGYFVKFIFFFFLKGFGDRAKFLK